MGWRGSGGGKNLFIQHKNIRIQQVKCRAVLKKGEEDLCQWQ